MKRVMSRFIPFTVAELILDHRHSKERYPAYITDLDISALAKYSQGTCGHLEVKKHLEEALYDELYKLG